MRHTSLALLTLPYLPFIASDINIPAQFYHLSTANTKSFGSADYLSDLKIPEVIRTRLGNREFYSLPSALQRAILWEGGLLPSQGNNNLQQVYVRCGRSMSDVFIPRDYVWKSQNSSKRCYYDMCNDLSLAFAAKEQCLIQEIEQHTRCGILDTADVPTVTQNPMWSEEGEIDHACNIKITKYLDRNKSHANNDASLFLIEEKPQIQLSKNNCPSKASFIVPCRKLRREDISSETNLQWCRPEKEVLVDLWLEKLDMEQKIAFSRNASPMSPITIVLLAFSILSCLTIMYMMYRLRVAREGQATKDIIGTALYCAPTDITSRRQVQVTSGSYNVAMLESERLGQHAAVDPAQRLSGWYATSQINARNAYYLKHSESLREFFEDSQLNMKRIIFTSLKLDSCISRDETCEVWRAEYEGAIVAVKRVFDMDRVKQFNWNISRDSGIESIASDKMRKGSSSTINSSRFSKLDEHGLETLEKFTTEIRLASRLEHPYIVRFIGLAWRSLHELSMVSEYMVHGDLATALLMNDKQSNHVMDITWDNGKLCIASNVASALVYLHSLDPPVLHGELTSRKVLLTERYEAKLCNSLQHQSGLMNKSRIAPEVLRGDAYTEKADVYSFGVLLSELDTQSIADVEVNGDIIFTDDCPATIVQLARSCVALDMDERPNAMQISYFLRSKVRPRL